jgi:hypothetical protein
VTAVYLECGKQRVFACALDWPGWCRAGRDEERALEALAASAPRYAEVAARAGVAFPAGDPLDAVERVPGSAGTDFGVPSVVLARDREPVSEEEAETAVAILRASWQTFDEIAARAPAELRKGPRGGGRARDAVVVHVMGAEFVYARKLGIRHPTPPPEAMPEAVRWLRREIAERLSRASDGSPAVERGWPPRYAARRIAWHVLDHAWEIEDRSPEDRV